MVIQNQMGNDLSVELKKQYVETYGTPENKLKILSFDVNNMIEIGKEVVKMYSFTDLIAKYSNHRIYIIVDETDKGVLRTKEILETGWKKKNVEVEN